jgi:hypothetical protein
LYLAASLIPLIKIAVITQVIKKAGKLNANAGSANPFFKAYSFAEIISLHNQKEFQFQINVIIYTKYPLQATATVVAPIMYSKIKFQPINHANNFTYSSVCIRICRTLNR